MAKPKAITEPSAEEIRPDEVTDQFEVPDQLRRKWASVSDAMAELKVSRDTIDRWRKEKKLAWRYYYGNRVLISRASMNALLEPFQ
jgi:hypothetical protein